jgi:hypothetical protein
VHILDPAKAPFQGRGKDNDRYFWPPVAEISGYIGTKLPRSQVVVEYSDIDLVEELLRFSNGARGVRQIPMLAQDGGSEEQILWIIVKKQNADGIFDQVQNRPSCCRHETEIGCRVKRTCCKQ